MLHPPGHSESSSFRLCSLFQSRSLQKEVPSGELEEMMVSDWEESRDVLSSLLAKS